MVEGLCECLTHVFDGDGDKFQSPLVLLGGRTKRGVLLGLLCVFLVASEVLGESNLYENEGASLFVEVGQ